jgi:hypothetical protein
VPDQIYVGADEYVVVTEFIQDLIPIPPARNPTENGPRPAHRALGSLEHLVIDARRQSDARDESLIRISFRFGRGRSYTPSREGGLLAGELPKRTALELPLQVFFTE